MMMLKGRKTKQEDDTPTSRDYTRVCETCGTAWLLPRQWATEKPPNERQVRGMQRATRFAMGRQRERYSMQAATLQASQDRVLRNGMCPRCGSSAFKQYEPGEAPAAGGGSAMSPPQQASVADELTKLAHLREAGVLTDEEFAAQKAQLLLPPLGGGGD